MRCACVNSALQLWGSNPGSYPGDTWIGPVGLAVSTQICDRTAIKNTNVDSGISNKSYIYIYWIYWMVQLAHAHRITASALAHWTTERPLKQFRCRPQQMSQFSKMSSSNLSCHAIRWDWGRAVLIWLIFRQSAHLLIIPLKLNALKRGFPNGGPRDYFQRQLMLGLLTNN
jgi:hypothetical protein